MALRISKLAHLSLGLCLLASAPLARAQGQPYLVKDIDAAVTAAGSAPTALARVGNSLYFAAAPFAENELWKTDGSSAGTLLVKRLGVAGAQNAGALAALNATTFVFAASDSAGREPWRSDGTSAGTVRVGDFNPGGADSVQ
ncbi:MAG TPA: hypothetical protein VKF60_00155, partial [Myxococcota bacterium]|nr:hypothetical protein [Myxococcota bacterium]